MAQPSPSVCFLLPLMCITTTPQRPLVVLMKLTRLCQTDKEVAERSVLIKNMLEDVGEVEDAIPIPNV